MVPPSHRIVHVLGDTRWRLNRLQNDLSWVERQLDLALPSNRVQVKMEQATSWIWNRLPQPPANWPLALSRPIQWGDQTIRSPQWDALCLTGRIQLQGLRWAFAMASLALTHPLRFVAVQLPRSLIKFSAHLLSPQLRWWVWLLRVIPTVSLAVGAGALSWPATLCLGLLLAQGLRGASQAFAHYRSDQEIAELDTLLMGPLLPQEREQLQERARALWRARAQRESAWQPIVDFLLQDLAIYLALGLPMAGIGLLGLPMLGLRVSALLGIGALLAPQRE